MNTALAERPEAPLAVNKRELAKILKCSLPTLNELIDRYADFPVIERGKNGVEWQFDPEAVIAFLDATREEEVRAASERSELLKQFTLPIDEIAPEGATELSPAQRASLAKARLAERKLAMEAGMLVPAAEARQVLQLALAKLGKFLDTLPRQIARAHNLPEEVQRSMRQRIDEQRRLFVAELKPILEQDA